MIPFEMSRLNTFIKTLNQSYMKRQAIIVTTIADKKVPKIGIMKGATSEATEQIIIQLKYLLTLQNQS